MGIGIDWRGWTRTLIIVSGFLIALITGEGAYIYLAVLIMFVFQFFFGDWNGT